MKLKTLKDLDFSGLIVFDQSGTDDTSVIFDVPRMRDRIKAEAINWVKYYQQIKYNEPNYAKRRIQIQWIEHFFNITLEDLL